VEDGQLFLDVGFDKYAQRIYPVENGGTLSIEIVTLRDFRAAYSLLSLLRRSAIQDGPPGNAFAASTDDLQFVQEREWIHIRGRGISGDLIRRIAMSISNRIGPDTRHRIPSLLTHVPKLGLETSSLRYFPGMTSYTTYSGSLPEFLEPGSDAEMAKADYSLNGHAGSLFLLNFPTAQVADEYFAGLTVPKSIGNTGSKIYAKQAGPIVAVLDGTFDPQSADRILSSLKFSYSVRWVYERGKEAKTVWGVPAAILGTVVKSLFFVATMCLVSIAAGICFGYFRFVLRERSHKESSDHADPDDFIRLRLP
jgi:hypothetical protein